MPWIRHDSTAKKIRHGPSPVVISLAPWGLSSFFSTPDPLKASVAAMQGGTKDIWSEKNQEFDVNKIVLISSGEPAVLLSFVDWRRFEMFNGLRIPNSTVPKPKHDGFPMFQRETVKSLHTNRVGHSHPSDIPTWWWNIRLFVTRCRCCASPFCEAESSESNLPTVLISLQV